MIFSKRKKGSGPIGVEIDNEMDITSLLDVLVILVIFLIQTYSSSDFTVDLIKDLSLPFSDSKQMSRQYPTVQMTKERIVWIDGKKIGHINGRGGSQLSAILAEKRDSVKDKVDEALEINIIVDKDLEYEHVQSLMDTCAMSGFAKFRFVVEGSD